MTNINYDLLRGERGGEPPDGIHAAYLAAARLVETDKGDALVTEWQTVGDEPYYWTTWFGFAANRIAFTQEFLESVGIKYADISDDDAMEAALAVITGNRFQVRTKAGAAWINTFVQGPQLGQQQQLEPDVPVDTAGLDAEPVTVPDDDPPPF